MNSTCVREKLYSVKHFIIHNYYKKIGDRYEKRQRKRIKNDNFSIICSNCIGGFIYHRLGKQFLSPTINLFFNQKEFVKFILNLDHYLNANLEFLETDTDYPIGKLDDITLYFLHYSNKKQKKRGKGEKNALISRTSM